MRQLTHFEKLSFFSGDNLKKKTSNLMILEVQILQSSEKTRLKKLQYETSNYDVK